MILAVSNFPTSSKKSKKVEMLILSKRTFDRRLIEMGNHVSTSIFLEMRRLFIGRRENLAGNWHTSKSDLNKVNYRRISLSRKCRIKVASISPNRIHFHADRVPLLRKRFSTAIYQMLKQRENSMQCLRVAKRRYTRYYLSRL